MSVNAYDRKISLLYGVSLTSSTFLIICIAILVPYVAYSFVSSRIEIKSLCVAGKTAAFAMLFFGTCSSTSGRCYNYPSGSGAFMATRGSCAAEVTSAVCVIVSVRNNFTYVAASTCLSMTLAAYGSVCAVKGTLMEVSEFGISRDNPLAVRVEVCKVSICIVNVALTCGGRPCSTLECSAAGIVVVTGRLRRAITADRVYIVTGSCRNNRYLVKVVSRTVGA